MWEDSLRLQECSIFLLNIHLTVLASTDDFLLETIISMVKTKWLLSVSLFPLHLLVDILLCERAILIYFLLTLLWIHGLLFSSMNYSHYCYYLF